MIRANVHQPFFRKFLFVFLGCLAYSGWCFYDGLVKYPKQLVIAEAYESLPDDEDRRDKWQTLAREKGWPTITPQRSAEDMKDLIGKQFFMIILCGLIGIPALLKWMSGQGTWIEGDESVIRNSKGQEVDLSKITKIDKRKWPAKGIAKIYYDVSGKSKKFTMDDFQYDRDVMGQLMRFAEAGLSSDQVEGDELERDKDAKKLAAQQSENLDDVAVEEDSKEKNAERADSAES